MSENKSLRTIVLTYKVEKTIEIEILDFTLTEEELDRKIESLLSDNAPDDGNIIDSDYEWWGDDEPRPKYTELVPPPECWVDVYGKEWATNGWCVVNRETPIFVRSDNEYFQSWKLATPDLQKAVAQIVLDKKSVHSPHTGYFQQHFANIAQIPGIKVCGKSSLAPAYCFDADRHLVAILMPIRVSDPADRSKYVTFNHT